MYEQSLIQAGLREEQVMVYEMLLKKGPQKAGKLANFLPIKRGLVYKTLDELIEMGLVEKKAEEGSIAVFHLTHPLHIKDLAEKKEQEARDAKLALEGVLPSIISDFNLISGQPGVLVYEGEEGVERVLDDSLTSKTIIYSYVDVEAVEKHIQSINARYMKKRERFDVYKKILVTDTPFTRDLYAQEKSLVTDVRMIPSSESPFEVSMQIYDDKVSYITLLPDRFLGVIIHDPSIYRMHKHLFEVLYEKAEHLA